MKLLVVEDQTDLLRNLVSTLQKENYQLETASTLETAMDYIVSNDYDCVLLDLGLPDGNGLVLLKKLRELKKTDSVIIISARGSLDDKIEGLGLGADDYLTKPFHLAELNARIKAVIRRKSFDGQKIVTINNLVVDPDRRTVHVDATEVPLKRKEYEILLYFLANKNRLISKTSIASHVWGDNIDELDSLDFIYSQIKNLRKKLKDHKAEVEIQAIYGVGYKFIASDAK